MRYFRRFIGLLFLVILAVSVLRILPLWPAFKIVRKQNAVTIDPWIQKHWNHVKIISEKGYTSSFKVILLWTKFFGTANFIPEFSKLGCPNAKCFVTSNRTYFNVSNALIFHLRDIDINDMPSSRKSEQMWILLHHESPPHTPDKLLKNLNNVFNWTATYRYDSEILLSPIFIKSNQTLKQPLIVPQQKKNMVAWLVSNCNTPSNRESFVQELQKSVPVDIYGACGPFTCLPKMSNECYDKLSQLYKFYLSFENSICKDYVTEKFFRILSTNMIPVVLGGANYSNIAPPNSYIDALAFKTPKDLALYLYKVSKDERKYQSYFTWKKSYKLIYTHYACQICKKLNVPDIELHIYKNISHWWNQDANCRSWL